MPLVDVLTQNGFMEASDMSLPVMSGHGSQLKNLLNVEQTLLRPAMPKAHQRASAFIGDVNVLTSAPRTHKTAAFLDTSDATVASKSSRHRKGAASAFADDDNKDKEDDDAGDKADDKPSDDKADDKVDDKADSKTDDKAEDKVDEKADDDKPSDSKSDDAAKDKASDDKPSDEEINKRAAKDYKAALKQADDMRGSDQEVEFYKRAKAIYDAQNNEENASDDKAMAADDKITDDKAEVAEKVKKSGKAE